jgi:oligopeptidase B
MTVNQHLQPPIARKQHTETVLHGVTLSDDYAWLRDKQNPEVTAYLEAENTYAEAVMAPLAGLREDLYQEMLSHVKQTDVSVPFRDGDWWYNTDPLPQGGDGFSTDRERTGAGRPRR